MTRSLHLLFALSFFFSALPSVQAATVDFNLPSDVKEAVMSPLNIGQEGSVSTNSKNPVFFSNGNMGFGLYTGLLPSMSKITFTYTAYVMTPRDNNPLYDFSLNLSANYAVDLSKPTEGNYAGALVVKDYLSDTNPDVYNTTLYAGSKFLLLSTSNFFNDENGRLRKGSITLENLSPYAAAFSTFLFDNRGGNKGWANYSVEAVSNVPLPAALPLFGLGLVGLAGYRRVKNKSNKA